MAETISDVKMLGKRASVTHSVECCFLCRLPPVTVTLPDLSSMWDFERTIKIADQGYGMKREILKRVS